MLFLLETSKVYQKPHFMKNKLMILFSMLVSLNYLLYISFHVINDIICKIVVMSCFVQNDLHFVQNMTLQLFINKLNLFLTRTLFLEAIQEGFSFKRCKSSQFRVEASGNHEFSQLSKCQATWEKYRFFLMN